MVYLGYFRFYLNRKMKYESGKLFFKNVQKDSNNLKLKVNQNYDKGCIEMRC